MSVGERWRNQTANNSRGFKICPTIRTRHTLAIPRPYRLWNALNNSSHPIHRNIVNTFKPINIKFSVCQIFFFQKFLIEMTLSKQKTKTTELRASPQSTGCPTIEFSLCFACFLGFQCLYRRSFYHFSTPQET